MSVLDGSLVLPATGSRGAPSREATRTRSRSPPRPRCRCSLPPARAGRPDPRDHLAAVRRGRERPGPRRADRPRGRHRRPRADRDPPRRPHRDPARGRARRGERRHGARLRRPQGRAARRMRATVRRHCCSAAGGGVARFGRWRPAPRSCATAGASPARADGSEGDPSFVWDVGVPRVAREWELDGAVRRRPDRPRGRARRAQPRRRRRRARGGRRRARRGARARTARARSRTAPRSSWPARAGWSTPSRPSQPSARTPLLRGRRPFSTAPRSDTPPEPIDWSQLTPYASGPRSWRERGQDLRLEGSRCGGCGRVLFPPPVDAALTAAAGELEPELLARAGTVVTETRDRAYPGLPLDRDGGRRARRRRHGSTGRSFPSARVAIGDRVRIVPRRLHDGGGAAQYFWKLAPEEVS